MLVVTFVLKAAPPLGADLTKRTNKDIWNQTLALDWLGGGLVLASVTSLVLALNWGGNTKPWSSAPVIAVSFFFFFFFEENLPPSNFQNSARSLTFIHL